MLFDLSNPKFAEFYAVIRLAYFKFQSAVYENIAF